MSIPDRNFQQFVARLAAAERQELDQEIAKRYAAAYLRTLGNVVLLACFGHGAHVTYLTTQELSHADAPAHTLAVLAFLGLGTGLHELIGSAKLTQQIVRARTRTLVQKHYRTPEQSEELEAQFREAVRKLAKEELYRALTYPPLMFGLLHAILTFKESVLQSESGYDQQKILFAGIIVLLLRLQADLAERFQLPTNWEK